MYCYKSLKEYLNDLAAKKPAPGGGSAAALSAALGVSLISMVVNFTLGKPKYAKYEKELSGILKDSEDLRSKFLDLVDLDVIAYKSKNIKEALDAPLKVCRFCFTAIKLCPPLIRKSNVNLISDVAVAAVLLESAFAAGYFNVEINLKAMQDKKLALGHDFQPVSVVGKALYAFPYHKKLTQSIRKELKAKQKMLKKIRLETEVKIGKIIRG